MLDLTASHIIHQLICSCRDIYKQNSLVPESQNVVVSSEMVNEEDGLSFTQTENEHEKFGLVNCEISYDLRSPD